MSFYTSVCNSRSYKYTLVLLAECSNSLWSKLVLLPQSLQTPLVSVSVSDPDSNSFHFTNANMQVEAIGSVARSQVTGAGGRGIGPQPCSLLSIGQAFIGTQKVSSITNDERWSTWRVIVRILGLDFERGYLCGTMETLNVYTANTPVVSFWEGDIIDTKNHTFFTEKDDTPSDNLRSWSSFPSFSPFEALVETDGGRSLDLSNHEHIYMIWREEYFMNARFGFGLSIHGYYHICFSCIDGSIDGLYYDFDDMPLQKLDLKRMNEGRSGFSSSSYEFQ